VLETGSDRVRRTATVQEDWLAWLPEAKDTLFAFTHHELEVSYSLLSVTLDDALTSCKQGTFLPARGQAAIFADLFERLADCLRGVLRALYEHGHTFGTLPNVVPLHSVFFRSERSQHIARTNSLLSFLVLRARTRFFRKLGALEQVLADLNQDAHHVAARMAAANSLSSLSMIKHWRRLEVLHYDLNTCLCETTVMLKSFFCVLPGEELKEFRARLFFLAPAIASRSKRQEPLPKTVPASRQPAAQRLSAGLADFSVDPPLPQQPLHNADNSGSGDRIPSSRMRPDGTGGPNETN
jgi:hypothetical protein